jgi:hypothetical protein
LMASLANKFFPAIKCVKLGCDEKNRFEQIIS